MPWLSEKIKLERLADRCQIRVGKVSDKRERLTNVIPFHTPFVVGRRHAHQDVALAQARFPHRPDVQDLRQTAPLNRGVDAVALEVVLGGWDRVDAPAWGQQQWARIFVVRVVTEETHDLVDRTGKTQRFRIRDRGSADANHLAVQQQRTAGVATVERDAVGEKQAGEFG